MYIDNIKNGTAWGCDPRPYDHDVFFGCRAIIVRRNGLVRWIDYLPDRMSARGDSKDLNRLRRWWEKRGGAASRWMKSGFAKNEVWTYSDAKAGNTAHVKATDDYAYISLYHDSPAIAPIAQ